MRSWKEANASQLLKTQHIGAKHSWPVRSRGSLHTDKVLSSATSTTTLLAAVEVSELKFTLVVTQTQRLIKCVAGRHFFFSESPFPETHAVPVLGVAGFA